MGKTRPVLQTSRGVLCRDDESITIADVCEAFTYSGDDRKTASSRAGAARCVRDIRAIRDQLEQYADTHGFITDDERELLHIFVRKLKYRPKCKMCGRDVRFNRQLCQYSTYCSAKCQNSDPAVKEKHAATNMLIYGTENAAKNEAVKAKQIATTTARYGKSCFLATAAGKLKSRDTCMEKYGVPHTSMVDEFNVRRHETMLARYGVSHALQRKESRDKFVATCTDRYGVAYPNVWKLREIHKLKRAEVYDSLVSLFPDYEIQCTRSSFLGLYEHENTWKCKSCGSVFTHYGVPFCKCHRHYVMQDELYALVKAVCPDAIANDRNALGNGKEIDVYVPSKKIGFEFDGLYWHSELYRDKNYHLEKITAAANNGIRLIHVFEDEWTLRSDIVKCKIQSLLGMRCTPINARSCDVVTLKRDVADEFLNTTHIQGAAISASVHMGLASAGEIVAVCTFGKIGGADGWWYLERYATKQGTRVRGGCGKLIAAFVREHDPAGIRTFADRRWSSGGMYESLGFRLKEIARPAYWYVKPSVSPIHRVHRFNLRKDVLIKELGHDAYGATESELAAMCGYVRVWDCGQLAYELTFDREIPK